MRLLAHSLEGIHQVFPALGSADVSETASWSVQCGRFQLFILHGMTKTSWMGPREEFGTSPDPPSSCGLRPQNLQFWIIPVGIICLELEGVFRGLQRCGRIVPLKHYTRISGKHRCSRKEQRTDTGWSTVGRFVCQTWPNGVFRGLRLRKSSGRLG